MLRYLRFASRTGVLVATGVGMVMLIALFSSLPVIGEQMLDLLPGYTFEQAVQKLESYGDRGRTIYIVASPTLDTLFPAVYVTLFAGLIQRFRPDPWQLGLVPVALGFVDLCENAQITAMLALYPDVPRGLVASASWFTQTKHLLTQLTLLTVVALGVVALLQLLRRKYT